MIMTLKDLSIEHDYYCADSNYYSNEAIMQYRTWPEFYDEMHNADIDMNLVFRWDIKKHEKTESYWMEIFIIQQRKGIFLPVMIDRVFDEDVETIIEYLKPHFEKLNHLWEPLSIKEVG